MEYNFENIITELKARVKNEYLEWSANIPFAEVDYDDSKTFERINFHTEIPPQIIRPETFIIDALDRKIIHELQIREIKDFVTNLKEPIKGHDFESTIHEISTQVEAANNAVFASIEQPNIIIWSRKMFVAYAKQMQSFRLKIANVKWNNLLISDHTFNQIFILSPKGFRKTYPQKEDERIRITINSDKVGNVPVDFNADIVHNLSIEEPESFARITVTK